MLSPALGRALRTSCTACASSTAASASRPAVFAVSSAQPLSQRKPFQHRRPSSSKASFPPNGSGSGTGATPETPATPAAKSVKRVSGRRTTKKSQPSSHMNVPRVPPTHHLRRADVDLSSFFSLHRPISVTAAIPPTATNASFDEMFAAAQSGGADKYNNVIFTLSDTVDALENASEPQDDMMHASTSGSVVHLDGVPNPVDLNRFVAQHRPFRPPPPPVPFDADANKKTARKQRTRSAASSKRASPKQKAWRTTITVTESTDSAGSRTYTASSSPMEEVAENSNSMIQEGQMTKQFEIRQPFLERMRVKQQRWMEYRDQRGLGKGNEMKLISVKRQRKLKMKKHKYKKLMKRTRNLRRKLGRL